MTVLLPPLELQAELVYPDGTTTRWDKDATQAKDRPTGITFKTQRYTGFADAQFALARRIDIDYPDLGLLEGINLIAHDGSVAYEGRIAVMPRMLQTSPSVGIQAQGWMSHAKDQTFTEVFVDRDLSKWVTPSRARSANILAGGFTMGNVTSQPDQAGNPSIETSTTGNWGAVKQFTEAWWLPQPGINIGYVYYKLAAFKNGGLAGWKSRVRISSDDAEHAFDETAAFTTAPQSGYLSASAQRTAALVLFFNEEESVGTAGATYNAVWQNLAVYGPHGLERRGTDPAGFYVSDLIRNIATRWAPKLNTSLVEPTTFIVPHASFTSETAPYDAFQTLNAFHRWETAVYEKRMLRYYPIDLTDYDWEIRLSDAGTTVSLQGDDAQNLCNGVIVRYMDLNTGYETRLSPETYGELRDGNPNNPVNVNGLQIYTTLTLSIPATKAAALQIGSVFLNEFNEAQAPGSITVTGHVRDRAGHWQQGWKVRASDRLIISDLPNDSVRVVGETSWDQDTKQLTLAVDSQFKRLDAILARLGVAIEASNLKL